METLIPCGPGLCLGKSWADYSAKWPGVQHLARCLCRVMCDSDLCGSELMFQPHIYLAGQEEPEQLLARPS